jgi:pimeloyl-ACP methyl ester carboxylesterase
VPRSTKPSAAKPTLLFLHGFRGDHHGLRYIADALADDYQTLLPDLPPFGHTKALAVKHDLAAYAKWLHDYIEECQLERPPILVAHSMGTIVAAYYAAKYPKTIDRRLVLVSPISRTSRGRRLGQAAYRAAVTSVGPLTEPAAKKFLASRPITRLIYSSLTSTRNPDTKRLIREDHFRYSGRFDTAAAFLESLEVSMTHDVAEFAPELRTETLIVSGAKDQLTRAPITKQLAATLRTEPHFVSDTGHLIIYEDPQAVADLIRDFLRPQAPSS